ncbi:MAG: hypothetical protein GY770_35295 [Aestuariibacter sp.]|nr:hypothetical protein [Aestuariibacter sp.]
MPGESQGGLELYAIALAIAYNELGADSYDPVSVVPFNLAVSSVSKTAKVKTWSKLIMR